MGAYRKLILDETSNKLKGVGFDTSNINTVSSQINKFDSTYSPNKIRDLFAEYDNVTVDKDLKNLSIVKTDAITKTAVGFRTKLYLTSASLIVCLLLFLVVYNIFVINNLNGGINILQNDVTAQETRLNEVYYKYNSVTDENELKNELHVMGYADANTNDVVELQLGETTQVVELEGETNWFDAFCNFISNLFAGS